MNVHSEKRPLRILALAIVAPLALLAAACSDDDDTATGDASDVQSDNGMSVEITSPANGDSVDSSFDVDVESSEELGEPDTGLHHVHLFYDGNTGEGEYDVVNGNSFTVDRDLGEGEHTVKAVLANADHSLTGAEHEITVTVGGGGGGGGGGNDDGGYGY